MVRLVFLKLLQELLELDSKHGNRCYRRLCKELELIGVGYRAKSQGKTLNLTLSYPVNYEVPEGIEISTPSQTEISISGMDKQKVGQVAAELRAIRPPEPYKGKGVRYKGEQISLKETKKKLFKE